MDKQALVDSLNKFLRWSEQQVELSKESDTAAASRLRRLLYGCTDDSNLYKLVGGQNAPIFADAADTIVLLRAAHEELQELLKRHAPNPPNDQT